MKAYSDLAERTKDDCGFSSEDISFIKGTKESIFENILTDDTFVPKQKQDDVLSENDDILLSVAKFMQEGNKLFDVLQSRGIAGDFLNCLLTSYERLKNYCEVVGAKNVAADCVDRIVEIRNAIEHADCEEVPDEKVENGIKSLLGFTIKGSGNYDVFISFKSEDSDLAERIYNYCQQHLKVPFWSKRNFDVLVEQSKTMQPVTTPELFKRLWNGCMPGLVSGDSVGRDIFYSSYLSTYVERDVRDLSGTVDALKFIRFITAVAARASQLVNYKAIAYDADIDQITCKNWINILETLGIVFLLHPYSNNVLKRTIKTPKLYFYDTGLVCYLTRWSSPEVAESGAMSGALLENFTVSEIMKSYQNAGREPFLHYYRDRDAKEIDVIMEGDGKLCPLEIKKTATPDKRLVRTFSVIYKSPLQLGTGAILCMADKFSAFDRENLIVPIWMI